MSLLDRIILLAYFFLAALGHISVSASSLAVLMLVLLVAAVVGGDGVKFNLFTRKPAP